jgi:predicted methyltransferase
LVEAKLKNVDLIKGAEDNPKLPDNALDGALIVNSYHEMTAHEAMLRHIRAALKPGGVLVVMDAIWDAHESKSRDEQTKHHELAPQFARQEVEKRISKLSRCVITLLTALLMRMGSLDGGFSSREKLRRSG